MAQGKAKQCSACDAPVMVPETARSTQFCMTCQGEWDRSPERARAVSARADFATRRRKELGK